MPRPNSSEHHHGRIGFITIRGPSRMEKKQAKEDGEKMMEAANEGGMSAVRAAQRGLNNQAMEDNRNAL